MQKNRELDRLHNLYSGLLVASKNHNILKAESSINDFSIIQDGFWDRINEYLREAKLNIEDLKEQYTDNHQYCEMLVTQLKSREIPAETYEDVVVIGPIDIAVHIDEYYLQISIGRKKLRITDLEMTKVVKLLEVMYRKLNRTFNSKSFFKQLLKAYEYVNAIKYDSKEVKYGYNVSLKSIFELFTLSPMASDYKLENFLWDLGRLVSMGTSFDEYRLELGYSREVGKMYLIKTMDGETQKASTLIIHKEEKHETVQH